MKHSELAATIRSAATGPSTPGWSSLRSTISRLKLSLTGRAAATATLPIPPAVGPAVPIGLAAALTLSMAAVAHARPKPTAADPFQEMETSMQLVARARPTPVDIAVARLERAAAAAPGDVVTPEALAAALAPPHDVPHFLIQAGRDHAANAWSGIFAMAHGPSLRDFAASDSAIAELVG